MTGAEASIRVELWTTADGKVSTVQPLASEDKCRRYGWRKTTFAPVKP